MAVLDGAGFGERGRGHLRLSVASSPGTLAEAAAGPGARRLAGGPGRADPSALDALLAPTVNGGVRLRPLFAGGFMRLPALTLGLSAVAFGGYALWDYQSLESRSARAIHGVEVLGPNLTKLDCVDKGPFAKSFTVAVVLDARPLSSLNTDAIKRGAIRTDCIRGAAENGTLRRAVEAMGPQGPAFLAKVINTCAFKKDEYPSPACHALEGLGLAHAAGELEKIALDRKQPKDIYLGALYRLMQTPAWRTPAQLAGMIKDEPDWEARELMLEKLRALHSPAALDPLKEAYAVEKDDTVRRHLHAAVLELENSGKCVIEDDGGPAGVACRYFCRELNVRPWHARAPKTACPDLFDPPQAAPSPDIAAASPVAR